MPDERIDPNYDWTETAGSAHVYMAGPRTVSEQTHAGAAGFLGVAGGTVVGLEHVDSARPVGASKIAFVRQIGATPYVMVMNADGSNVTRLLPGEDPAWSPDGTTIVFAQRRELYKVAQDSLLPIRFDQDDSWPGDGDARPAWSPDGDRIVFDRPSNVQRHEFSSIGSPQLHMATSDGARLGRLTSVNIGMSDPSWSPDGDLVACSWHTGEWGGTSGGSSRPIRQIVVVDLDGTIVASPGPGGPLQVQVQPAWSPDGTRITFSQRVSDYFHLHMMNVDGSNLVRLTDGFTHNLHPSWSPDGRRLAFQKIVDGHSQIYTMNADGSDARQITHSGAQSFNPAWTSGYVPARTVLLGSEGLVFGQIGSAGIFGHLEEMLQSALILDTAEKGRTETKVIALKSTQVNKVCQVFVVSAPLGVTEIRYSNNLLEQGKQDAVKLDFGGKFAGAVVVLNSATARIEAVAGVSVGQEGGFPAVSAAAEKDGIVCRGLFSNLVDGWGKSWSQGDVTAMRFDAKTGSLVAAF